MIRSKHNKKDRPMMLRIWLSANDPGYIRLISAGRAALTLLSIWLVLRTAVHLLFAGGGPPLPLLGVLSGIIFLLFIIDLRPADRLLSLWLAPIPFAGAVLLGSFLGKYFWPNNLILLLLFFFSYFSRRYGPRAGELVLVTTVGYYLGFLLHLPQSIYLLFLACVATGVLAVYLWQFVIIPYNPAGSLHRSVSAFYHSVALTIATIRQGLESVEDNSQINQLLQRQSRQVHRNRRVIESLFAAIVSPTSWSQARLNRLQEEMFKTEQGLELLVDAAKQLWDQSNQPPGDILQNLVEGLDMLEADLWSMASGKGLSRLSDIGDRLQSQVKSSRREKTSEEWVFPLLRLSVASGQLSRSVADIRAIEIAWQEKPQAEKPLKSPALHPSKPPDNRGVKSKYNFHPTTILGLQAVLATGLAMLAAYLLKIDQPNLVYWTAFVVIAGSTGESLRRMSLRIIGVIAGTVIGVLLAFILLNNLVLVVLSITICIFMMVYMIPASYIWMVFWLNIGMMLIITTLGGPALHLLVVRPVSTLLGAAVAALVVVFVLPIHVQDRFAAALSGFLKEVDHYIEVYVKTLIFDAPETVELKTEVLKIDASYKNLELNLPNVVFEYNPLSRAQNPLASQATSLAVLKDYVTRLYDNVGGEPGSLVGVKDNKIISEVQSHIHQTTEALNNYLVNQQGQESQLSANDARRAQRESALEGLLSAEPGSTDAIRNRALYHLKRIDDTILQIASGLGASVPSSKNELGG